MSIYSWTSGNNATNSFKGLDKYDIVYCSMFMKLNKIIANIIQIVRE